MPRNTFSQSKGFKKATPARTTSWGGVANWYDDLLEREEGTFQKEVILPNLTRLLALKKGAQVLDLACGQGFFSRAWQAVGAHVVASDISPELISLARKNSPKEIVYHVSPASDISFVESASVDAITIVLAIQNIERVEPVMKECARVLRAGGKIFLVLNHPSFRNPKATSWGWDEEKKIQYRRVDQYLTERKLTIEMHPGADRSAVTFSFHRPLQLYVKHLSRAGFAVTDLEEWVSHRASTSGPRAPAENKSRLEIPMFMCVGAVKL